MSDPVPNDAARVIEAFGGIRPMAKKLGVAVTTVQGWKERNAIPIRRLDELPRRRGTGGNRPRRPGRPDKRLAGRPSGRRERSIARPGGADLRIIRPGMIRPPIIRPGIIRPMPARSRPSRCGPKRW